MSRIGILARLEEKGKKKGRTRRRLGSIAFLPLSVPGSDL